MGSRRPGTHRPVAREPLCDLRERHIGGEGRRGRRQRVADRRLAETGDLARDAALGGPQQEGVAPVRDPEVVGAHVCSRPQAEAQDPRRGALGLGVHPCVVRVEHRHGVRAERRHEVTLLSRDLLAAAEELDVGGADVGDHAHRRPGDGGQARDLAAMVHAELHDDAVVAWIATQQRERKPELVVEIAGVLEARRRHAEDRGTHLLGRRLAVAAGDRDQRAVVARAVARRQRTERPRRVVGGEDGQIGCECVGQCAAAFDEEARGAALDGPHQVVVGVEVRPADRHEQLSGPDRARVDRHSREARGRGAAQLLRAAPAHHVASVERNRHPISPRAVCPDPPTPRGARL
jgi:hypothetical protein